MATELGVDKGGDGCGVENDERLRASATPLLRRSGDSKNEASVASESLVCGELLNSAWSSHLLWRWCGTCWAAAVVAAFEAAFEMATAVETAEVEGEGDEEIMGVIAPSGGGC